MSTGSNLPRKIFTKLRVSRNLTISLNSLRRRIFLRRGLSRSPRLGCGFKTSLTLVERFDASLSVSQPRGFGARGHCAPPSTISLQPCVARVPAGLDSPPSIGSCGHVTMAAVSRRHRGGEAGHRDSMDLLVRTGVAKAKPFCIQGSLSSV